VTIRRSDIVDAGSPGVYHCVSRCVRREFLLNSPERRAWIVNRLRFLANWMAIDVISFAVMHNHIHLLLAIRPDVVESWSDQEVAERRVMLMPNSRLRRQEGVDPDGPPTAAEISRVLSNAHALARARTDLCSLGFFHRLLKEPCARLWNRQDGVTGHFWEGRFKSPRVLDVESLVRVAQYIELNEIHAGSSTAVEKSVWTSAYSQWRRMVAAIQAAIRQQGADPTPESIAACVLAEDWRPALPCRTQLPSRDAEERGQGTERRGPPPLAGWAGAVLEPVDSAVKLASYLERLHRVGRLPRPDKRGRVDAISASPIEVALRAAVGLGPESGDAAPPIGTPANAALCQFITKCRDVLSIGGLSPSCSISGFADGCVSVVDVASRGTCYGSSEAVRREARRRGRSRLWGGFRADDDGLSAA
jgi:REP element-mobilizing transposase RayT